MFTSDFAEDFSGLSQGQILQLEKKGILTPSRQRGLKYYSFNDIYVLKTIRILRREGIKHLKIENAFEYLRTISPEDSLSSFVLLHDFKEVYSVIDGRKLQASRYGQLVLESVLDLIAVGSELEATRKVMAHFVKEIKRASQAAQKGKIVTYSPEDIQRLTA
jgi:DNA-binding transcriptional MerR regulator